MGLKVTLLCFGKFLACFLGNILKFGIVFLFFGYILASIYGIKGDVARISYAIFSIVVIYYQTQIHLSKQSKNKLEKKLEGDLEEKNLVDNVNQPLASQTPIQNTEAKKKKDPIYYRKIF